MRKFSFSLAHVLRLREQEESMARMRLGFATRKVEEVDQKIEFSVVEAKSALSGISNPLTMHVAQMYVIRMKETEKRLRKERIPLEEARLQLAKEYIGYQQKTEILVKLREKHYEKWKHEYNAHLDKEADDFVAARVALYEGDVVH